MIEVSEEQVLYFRARRGHLAGPGTPHAAAAARAIIGAQSQQLAPSLLALSLRTRSRPTATQLKKQLALPGPKLVRTWGQRETLFIYDPTDWPYVVSARADWAGGARRGPLPTDAALDEALAVIKAERRPVSRTDLLGVAPKSYVKAIADYAAAANLDAERFAAGRLIWCLANRGDVCVAEKSGVEQTYAARSRWISKSKTSWPKKPIPTPEATTVLTRRYLAVHGPATAADIAHFFGARVTNAKEWLATLETDLTAVECGNRKGLVALTEDTKSLQTEPPAAPAKWPLRLLPLWEAMLMAHADKSWTTPHEPDRKIVWRRAAYVAAVALDRGRIVATWTQKETRGRLAVMVIPLSQWRKTKHGVQAEAEAEAVAAHLDLEGADVTIGC